MSKLVRFTQRGEIRHTICLDGSVIDPLLCFDLTDSTVGVESQHLPDLLEAYRQVNNPASVGTGLDVTISRRLAEKLGYLLPQSNICVTRSDSQSESRELPSRKSVFIHTPAGVEKLAELGLLPETLD